MNAVTWEESSQAFDVSWEHQKKCVACRTRPSYNEGRCSTGKELQEKFQKAVIKASSEVAKVKAERRKK